MNKKGFTVVEVVIAFSLLAVLVVALIRFTVTYRDKVREEESRTAITDFKNTITKIIYDDIIMGGVKKIEKLNGCPTNTTENMACVNFIDWEDKVYPLVLVNINRNPEDDSLKNGLYLKYNDIYYMLPESKMNNQGERPCEFVSDFIVNKYENVYNLKISFIHHILDEIFDISITTN